MKNPVQKGVGTPFPPYYTPARIRCQAKFLTSTIFRTY